MVNDTRAEYDHLHTLSDEALCDRACRCPTRVVWQKVSDALESAVDGISLQDMADDALRSAETAE